MDDDDPDAEQGEGEGLVKSTPSDAPSPITKQRIQKITSTFDLPPNFFTAHFNHHHSGRHSHTPTTPLQSLVDLFKELRCDEESSGDGSSVLLLKRGNTAERGGTHSHGEGTINLWCRTWKDDAGWSFSL